MTAATVDYTQSEIRIRRMLFIGMMLLTLGLTGCVGSTSIVYTNQTVCGTIRVELTNSQTGVTDTHDVPMGESLTLEVAPNITYAYVVDYTTADNDTGMQCIAIHRGQLNVEPGTSQTFNLTAVTPTPSAVP
ncbi:hypothetical protein ACFLYO_03095 [Chloroflexota bacterium]